MIRPYKEDPAVRAMRVRAWFEAVSSASGKTSAELEQEFSIRKSSDKAPLRSCIWEKYRLGEILPRGGISISGKQNLVARVEAIYPGTAKWLDHLLWRVVDKAPLEMSEIFHIYNAQPKLIKSIFVSKRRDPGAIFWRRPVDAEHAYEILIRMRTIDALVALLTTIREAETVQNQEQHMIGIKYAKQLLTMKVFIGVGNDLADGDLVRYLERRWESPRYIVVEPE